MFSHKDNKTALFSRTKLFIIKKDQSHAKIFPYLFPASPHLPAHAIPILKVIPKIVHGLTAHTHKTCYRLVRQTLAKCPYKHIAAIHAGFLVACQQGFQTHTHTLAHHITHTQKKLFLHKQKPSQIVNKTEVPNEL